MAWRASAGTYRIGDGREQCPEFGNTAVAPLNSWPDNVSLDKTRRLLWPIGKYGRKISWADLMILAGNCALDSWGSRRSVSAVGAKVSGSRKETFYWGPEGKWLADERYTGDRDMANPLAAVQMGLIYVIRKGRTASRIRSPRPGISGRLSPAWR